MDAERRILKGFEISGGGLIEVLSQLLSEGAEVNHRKP
jgi:hypothetical protein